MTSLAAFAREAWIEAIAAPDARLDLKGDTMRLHDKEEAFLAPPWPNRPMAWLGCIAAPALPTALLISLLRFVVDAPPGRVIAGFYLGVFAMTVMIMRPWARG